MPKDDIKDLYEKAEQHLKARRQERQKTIVDGAPPPAPLSGPAPVAVPPRPAPRAPAQEPELFSEPEASSPSHTPLPSHFPSSEAPTAAVSPEAQRKQQQASESQRRRRQQADTVPDITPSVHAPLSKEDEARAKKSRTWNPPDWLVAVAKWVAPPIMLCLMAGAYWFQAKVTLVNEQAQALSEIRKQKDADYEKMKKDNAELEERLGLAQRDRDAYAAAAARWEILYKQGALKVKTSQDKPGD